MKSPDPVQSPRRSLAAGGTLTPKPNPQSLAPMKALTLAVLAAMITAAAVGDEGNSGTAFQLPDFTTVFSNQAESSNMAPVPPAKFPNPTLEIGSLEYASVGNESIPIESETGVKLSNDLSSIAYPQLPFGSGLYWVDPLMQLEQVGWKGHSPNKFRPINRRDFLRVLKFQLQF